MLVLTALALISFDERGSGAINSARSTAADVIQPVRDLASNTFNPVTDWLDGLGRASELQSENDRLRRELAQAKSDAAAGAAAQARLKELQRASSTSRRWRTTTAWWPTSPARARASTARSPSTRAPTTASSRTCRSWWVARWSARCYRVTKSAAIVQRIDDRQFGVGAQLIDKDQFGPVGHRAGQIDSRNLVFAVIEGAAGVAMKKGEIAITDGGLGSAYPRGLPIGTVARDVTAGGSVARNAELKPIVDLDSLDVVKVLRYRPPAAP